MTMQAGLAPRSVVTGQVVEPTAYVDPKSVTVHSLADVLRTLVHRSVGAFHTEADQDKAMKAINDWERQQLNASSLRALLEENPGRAEKEDVSLRIPPNNVAPTAVQGQPIDYNKLAAAIVAAQQAAMNPPVEGQQ
jgi:hypothetical protein